MQMLPRRRLSRVVLAALFAAAVVPAALHAQRAKPGIGADGTPLWSRTLRMPDGRTFVSDGAIALDAALAKPKEMPKQVIPEAGSKVIEKFMAGPFEHEYTVAQLRAAGSNPRAYEAPSGVSLGADYVDYIARTVGKRSVRFRVNGDRDPIAIVADGKAVGVLMPRAPARDAAKGK